MSYLAARAAERADPTLFAPDAQSMILVAASYAASNTGSGEEGTSSHPSSSSHPEPVEGCELDEGCAPAITQGRIARYACGPDYHDVIKPKLHAIDAFIRARTGREVLGKVFVDTAPVLERDFAEQAGLGFIGRNCCLITPGLGSWTFLAGIMVPEELEAGLPALRAWKLEAGNPSENRTEHPELVEGCDPPQSPDILRHGYRASQNATGPSDRRERLATKLAGLWPLHPLPGCLPDPGLCRTACAGRSALHLVFDHRTARPDPQRVAAAHGQLGLRLRCMSGGVPVQQAGQRRSSMSF